MNRSLAIPAVGCLVAFAIVVATFRSAADSATPEPIGQQTGDSTEEFVSIPAPGIQTKPAAPKGNAGAPMNGDEARVVITTLTEEYMRPWREWQKSPHHLYSRAAPRPAPSISSDVTISPPADESGSFFLATIMINRGQQSEATPCIVDRQSKRVFVFANGSWITGDKWAASAALP